MFVTNTKFNNDRFLFVIIYLLFMYLFFIYLIIYYLLILYIYLHKITLTTLAQRMMELR